MEYYTMSGLDDASGLTSTADAIAIIAIMLLVIVMFGAFFGLAGAESAKDKAQKEPHRRASILVNGFISSVLVSAGIWTMMMMGASSGMPLYPEIQLCIAAVILCGVLGTAVAYFISARIFVQNLDSGGGG